jgi:hypothetical protein
VLHLVPLGIDEHIDAAVVTVCRDLSTRVIAVRLSAFDDARLMMVMGLVSLGRELR